MPKSVESPTGRVEGVRREAPDSGPALSYLILSYRQRGAVSPKRRRLAKEAPSQLVASVKLLPQAWAGSFSLVTAPPARGGLAGMVGKSPSPQQARDGSCLARSNLAGFLTCSCAFLLRLAQRRSVLGLLLILLQVVLLVVACGWCANTPLCPAVLDADLQWGVGARGKEGWLPWCR